MKKHIVALAASLALAQFSTGTFAQQAAPAAWAGWARCQINVQGPGYTDQQTHTWTIAGGAPTAQGAFQIYPGTWSVVGGGSLSRSQGTQTLRAQWATNAPDISAPIAVFVRASDNRMFIQARHAQLRSAAAIQGFQQVTINGMPQTPGKIDAAAFEWAFPVIAVSAPIPPDRNATASGSSTSPVTGSVGLMQPAGSQATASCTWQFGQGSAAPAPPPTNPQSARLLSISPTTVEQGAIGTIVTLTGQGTHWSTRPTIAVTPDIGAPITIAEATSDTDMLGNFDVQYGAAPGPRTITVTAGSEVVTLPNAFTVTARARPELVSVTPNHARQGERNLTVQLTGRNTRWTQGATRVRIAQPVDASQPGTQAPSPGVTVVSTTVHSQTRASAVLNVEDNAVMGSYWFSVFDAAPSDWLKIEGGFTVEAGATATPPMATVRLVSVAPGSVEQGVSISDAITLTGEGTHWQQGTTTVNFGPGITLQGTVRVNSPTSLTTQFTVSHAAASGPRPVTVTTGNETVTLANALTITAREQPVITQISPNKAPAGTQNLIVTLTGRGTRWEQGTTTLLPVAGLGAGSLSVSSPTSARVTLNIDPAAVPGPREITVLNRGVVVGSDIITLPAGFTVNPPRSALEDAVVVPLNPGVLPAPTLCTLRGPEKASGLTNYATPGAAYLDWSAVAGATSYTVSRSDLGVVTSPPLSTANTSFVHKAILPHPRTYVYTITATYRQGCGSTNITLTSQPPATPLVSHRIENASGGVTLSWSWPSYPTPHQLRDFTGILVTGPALPPAGREIRNLGVGGDHTYIEGVPAGSRTWTLKAYWDAPGGRVMDNTGRTITVMVP